MSSNNKTPNLSLNSWEGSDKPKRADFNYDNEVIDTVVGEHITDEVRHVTSEEREKFLAPFYIDSYIGNGYNTRSFHLDFEPSFIIIFSNHVPLATYDKETDHIYAFAGIGTPLYSTTGLYLEGTKVTITDSTGVAPLNNFYPRLNMNGYRYQYIAFK